MPVGFGQLGCSGFVVSDEHGRFISRKTKAYLQYGEGAFRDLEKVVEGELKRIEKMQVPQAMMMLRDNSVAHPGTKTDGRDQPGSQADSLSLPLTLMGVHSMDREHEECDQALRGLLSEPTIQNLQQVLEKLKRHFAHEEAIMQKYRFGGDLTSPLSALHSHVKDHKRILEMGETELQRLTQESFSTPSCLTADGN
jgi:hypothetical protein